MLKSNTIKLNQLHEVAELEIDKQQDLYLFDALIVIVFDYHIYHTGILCNYLVK